MTTFTIWIRTTHQPRAITAMMDGFDSFQEAAKWLQDTYQPNADFWTTLIEFRVVVTGRWEQV